MKPTPTIGSLVTVELVHNEDGTTSTIFHCKPAPENWYYFLFFEKTPGEQTFLSDALVYDAVIKR